MTLNISVPTTTEELRPKITVIGVGGAGGNAVNNMITAQLEGVDFLVANTDGQSLASSLADRKIQLGRQHTQGLGAGSKPEIGRIATEESIDDILAELADSHMVFITAGMGGGTGTGAAPMIAKAARERGILTVGVVTKPFDFEGGLRMKQATAGIEELQAYVDTLIIIPNQNLFRLANERTTFADAFAMADEVLHQGVCGVTDLMIKPGLINLDFADIRAVMSEMGKAMMGTGEASGENRATNAAEAAINNPLLDETTMKGAQAVLINITGGSDMTLFEVDEAANHIRREVDSEATIIFGSALDERMEGIMRVSVVATGMEAGVATRPRPMPEIALKPLVSATPTGAADAPVTADMAATASMTARTMPDDSPGDSTGAASMEATPDTPPPIGDADHTGDADPMGADFTFTPEPPPMAGQESSGAADPASDETSFSDDPNQHNLMDMTGGEAGEASAPESGPADSVTSADSVTPADPAAPEDEPFILRDTVDPEETPAMTPGAEVAEAAHGTQATHATQAAHAADTSDGGRSEKGGLMRGLSRIFTGKDTPRGTENPHGGGRVTLLEPVMTSGASTTPAASAASETASAKAETATEATPLRAEPSTPSSAPSSAVSQTPAPSSAEAENQFDITTHQEDVDLEIPAFLRRQAN